MSQNAGECGVLNVGREKDGPAGVGEAKNQPGIVGVQITDRWRPEDVDGAAVAKVDVIALLNFMRGQIQRVFVNMSSTLWQYFSTAVTVGSVMSCIYCN